MRSAKHNPLHDLETCMCDACNREALGIGQAPSGNKGELVIGTSAERILVRIQKDGSLTYGPEYTPDEAAKVFWESLAKQRKQNEEPQEERILFNQLMLLMKRLGEQDLTYETCQKASREKNGKDLHLNFQEERAANSLNMTMHEIIELARGLTLRDQANNRGNGSMN